MSPDEPTADPPSDPGTGATAEPRGEQMSDSRSVRRYGRRDRIAVAVATLATLVPVWVAVVRVGLQRLIPVGDTAIMALRAPDVLSTAPPLIGMPASSASGASQVVHFPGAWQLYWLALPLEVLGATWGTVVAMGALSSIWIALSVWLLCRNLDPPAALWGIAVVGAFCWAVGSGMLIDAWPLRMIIVPFLCVLIAAWATAVGDRAALVVLAAAANYAFLDHLVLALAVPLVVLVACVAMLVDHVRANRRDPVGAGPRRRRFRRAVLQAAAVTVVMWLPPLVQQVKDSPGNLWLLVTGAGGGPGAIGSVGDGIHVLASLVGRPPFWGRGTLGDPTFYRTHHTGFVAGSVTWFDLVVVVVVAAVFAGLALLAVRARDRVGLALLGTALTAVVAGVATVYLAPVTTAVVPEYLYSAWVTAAVVWLAVAVNVVRRIGPGAAGAGRVAGLGVAVVFGLLSLPTSPTGATTDPDVNRTARRMSAAVLDRVDGDGPVAVSLENTFVNDASYLSALLVELRDHGVVFCYPTPNTSLYDFIPDCGSAEVVLPRSNIVIADESASDPPAGEVVFREPLSVDRPDARIVGIERRLETWLRDRSTLEVTAAARRPFLGPMIPEMLQDRVATLAPENGNLGHLVDDAAFRRTILIWWHRADARHSPLFEDQPVSPTELYDWASARHEADLTLWVTLTPVTG